MTSPPSSLIFSLYRDCFSCISPSTKRRSSNSLWRDLAFNSDSSSRPFNFARSSSAVFARVVRTPSSFAWSAVYVSSEMSQQTCLSSLVLRPRMSASFDLTSASEDLNRISNELTYFDWSCDTELSTIPSMVSPDSEGPTLFRVVTVWTAF